jgi:hypothetical protein
VKQRPKNQVFETDSVEHHRPVGEADDVVVFDSPAVRVEDRAWHERYRVETTLGVCDLNAVPRA